MLQKMEEHDDEIALHGLLRAEPKSSISSSRLATSSWSRRSLRRSACLLLDPKVEVALVERRMLFGHRIRACHVTASPSAGAVIVARSRDGDESVPDVTSLRPSVRHSARICLIRAIASSTACSGLMPSAATRWIAFDQTRRRERRQEELTGSGSQHVTPSPGQASGPGAMRLRGPSGGCRRAAADRATYP